MRKISQLMMLFRGYVEVPDGVNIATDEFHDGWSFVLSGDSKWMDLNIRAHGWNFIWTTENVFHSGIGKTSKEATENALRLALHRIPACFNVVAVADIEVTNYPWFTLARVRIYPCKIHPGAEHSPEYSLDSQLSKQPHIPRPVMQSYAQTRSRSLLKQSILSAAQTKEG